MSSSTELIRETRRRCHLSQESLARRAGTTPRHVGRIERGEVSPTVEMLNRLLAAMGRQLDLTAAWGPRDNRDDAQLRSDAELSPSERLSQTAALSRTLTAIAASARHRG
ncbi:MAG TPA: helix-turn-helix transcriptional regulator [Solirubrobacteraceae bacterium]|nr:helix-turn-helix transcriptional regulator [Solirubrobacteraceae bacterium]